MTTLATITSKNQLTLPMAAVTKLGLQAGSRVILRLDSNHLIIEKIPTLRELNSTLSVPVRLRKVSVEKAIKIAREREAKKIAHEA